MAKIGNTTSYELQQGAGEASDWQDRESEKLETPWKQASCWSFCHKGGMGFFLKNEFSFKNGLFLRKGFFTFGRHVFFFSTSSLSVCWDYIKEIQGTILPSLATLPAEAPTRS